MRPWRASPQSLADLTDSLDRELMALILGGQRIHSLEHDPLDVGLAANARGSDSFAMVSGGWGVLLKRLAETGRAFVVDDEPESGDADTHTHTLQWGGGEPWVLWLVGRDTGDELALHVEFRREAQTLEVQQPEVVLGGPDGLLIHEGMVYGLDDRDAFRWVQHYRDLFAAHGRISPLKVAQNQVPQFLEKLYTLPSLPELELPEGVGPLEEHATPLPHLELYSPGSGPGFGNGKEPGFAAPLARNLLSARLWFAYGSHRIKPGQAGRFLPGDTTEVVTTADTEAATSQVNGNPGEDVVVDAAANALDLAESVEDELATQARTENPPELEDDDDFDRNPDMDNGEEEILGGRVSFSRDQRPVIIRRDLRGEEQALSLLIKLGFRPELGNGSSTELLGSVPVKSMPMVVMQLLAAGWVVTADRKIMARPGAANLSVTSGMDWFELRGGITFTRNDGTQEIVPLPAVLQAARDGRTLITLGDGSQGLLPEQWLAEHGLLAGVAEVDGDVLKFKRTQAAMLDTLLARQEMVQVDDVFALARKQLQEFEGIKPVEAPALFQGSLRPYQKDGLGWLAFLRQFGMGGVLADDMGLGKTIQVLAMLLSKNNPLANPPAADAGVVTGGQAENPTSEIQNPKFKPSLVIAPRSVVFNWIDEAHKFVPGLRVQAYTGTERQSLRQAFAEHDLVITTYGLIRRDIDELRKHPFTT
ncbi:MAG: hypothetical protein HC898_07890 [Phycisphaerales bacterium]|nr:hypothetical protein [Phycisphaerales bacterium]